VSGSTIPILRPYTGAEEADAVRRVLESGWLGMGEVTREFERRVAALAGARNAVAVATGCAALHVALAACELGPGDEVIVPSLSFVGGVQAILAVGARPVFCEALPGSATLDVDDAARRVTPRTRAIMAVDYAGFPCALDEVAALAREHGLVVIEDGAHAFGSSYGGRPVGSIADVTAFSFDPVKSVTCGEGGALTTDDDDLAERARLCRNLGVGDDAASRQRVDRGWDYRTLVQGFRYQLSDLNAGIGLAQIDRFETFRRRKQELLSRYLARLKKTDALRPIAGDVGESFPFLCVVRVSGGKRDGVMRALAAEGISSSVHFPPNHLQPAFAAYASPLPVTERLYGELLTLPLYYGLRDDEVDRIAASVRTFVEAG
jgi:perosamine synthetase